MYVGGGDIDLNPLEVQIMENHATALADVPEVGKTVLELAKALPAKHLLFANLVLSGISQVDAYLQTYPNCSEDAARRSASKLMTNHDILAYVDESKSQLARQSLYDRFWKRQMLIETVQRSMQLRPLRLNVEDVPGHCRFDGMTAVRAIAEMNKMDGDYADTNIKVTQETHAERVRRLAALRS